MDKNSQTEYNPQDFDKLEQKLDTLADNVQSYIKDPKNTERVSVIMHLLDDMKTISKHIGGSIDTLMKELSSDITMLLKDGQGANITPKIFQDFQLLKRYLKSL